jgi:hypothetical protein
LLLSRFLIFFFHSNSKIVHLLLRGRTIGPLFWPFFQFTGLSPILTSLATHPIAFISEPSCIGHFELNYPIDVALRSTLTPFLFAFSVPILLSLLPNMLFFNCFSPLYLPLRIIVAFVTHTLILRSSMRVFTSKRSKEET